MKIQEDSTVKMDVDDVKNSCDNGEIVQKKRKKKRKEEKENTVVSKDKINGLPEENGHTENGVDENTEPSNKHKRKRKLKEISDGSKKEKKKKKLEENSVEEGTEKEAKSKENVEEKEESSDEKISAKESKMFNGKFLRKSFASPEGLNILRKFLVICNENHEKDLAAEYLLSGGSILEILRLLDSTEKKNIANISTVFSAIHILLMKILSKYPQYQSSAEEACRHLINSHLSSIHTMLSPQSAVKRRKIVLKLLVSMVSLGGSLPREILAHLSLSSQILESLVKHTKPTDPQNVRTCFLHFILAFLVEGNSSIIRNLLEKRSLLPSLFPGMIYDSQGNVNLILTALKTFVLENSAISKTLKLSVFSTQVVQSLVSLYNWKGPKNWPPGKNNSYLNSEEFAEEKETTISIVHEFLLILLTSHRHGIVFHDRSFGTSGNWHNQLANTVLLSLDRPWEHEKPAKLVLGILRACPDLVKSQFQLLHPFLEPRLSQKWIKAIKFLGEIVEFLDHDLYLKNCSREISNWQFFAAITTITVPSAIVKIAILPALKHESLTVRQEGISMLSIMLGKLKKFISAAEIHCAGFIDIVSLKNNVNDYVTKNLPSLNEIFGVWEKVLSTEKKSEEIENETENLKQRHFAEILNLLHVYREICPELLENSTKISPGILLTGLNELKNLDDLELNSMKVKAIQLLLVLEPSEFLPQKETFSKTLTFLINLLDEKSAISQESMETVKTLLKFSGVFDGCDDQMEIWIRCFFDISNANDRAEVVDWFLKSIKSAVKNSGKYMKIMSEAEEFPGEKIVNSERITNIFDELSEDTEDVERSKNNFVKMQKTVSIPIVLPSALQELKNNSSTILPRFAAFILAHTLHCQVSAGPLLRLIEDFEKFPPYFASWTIGRPTYLKKTLESLSLVCKLSKILIEENPVKAEDVFREKQGRELSDFEILTSLKMTVFYLTQFAQKEIFTETLNENCKAIIEFLLTKAKEKNVVENCAKFLFTHPIILQLFSPLRQKKDKAENLITNDTILAICRTVSRFNEKWKNQQLFLPFRNKMMDQLRKIMKNEQRKSNLNPKIVTEFLELLCLKTEDIVSLLIALMQLNKRMFLSKDREKLSIFGHILPKLLNMLCEKKVRRENDLSAELDGKFVTKFSFYLTFFKRDEKFDWTEWEQSFCNYLTTFPHHIAQIDPNSFFYLLKREMNPSTVKLISIICASCSRIATQFERHAVKSEKIMREKSLVFPVMQENLAHKWSEDFLRKLNDSHREEIVSHLIDPQNPKIWVEENFKAVGFLIENHFDLKTCQKTCGIISQIGDKLDLVSWRYVEMLENLFHRFSALCDDKKNPLMIFLQILVHITTLTLKKESKNAEKLSLLCEKLRKTVGKLREGSENFLYQGLADGNSWSQFTRFSLKMGLKNGPKDDGTNLLRTLKDLCDVAYKDNGENEYAKVMFEMTTSHSEFINVMLATGKDSAGSGKSPGNLEDTEKASENSQRDLEALGRSSGSSKRDLVEFLYTLIRKNKSVMNSSHVPLYLSAYNGTLDQSDQFLLLILRFYEENSVRINEYRPYLWGNAAATHYSVKGEADTALWRQPSTSQVLNLLDQEVVENTIRNYPVDRGLTGVEKCDLENIYDPAFYLPLLCHLLSDNNVVACHRVMQSGALALIFSSLASNRREIRLTAYTALARFYFHLEGTSSKDKLLWMRLVDALRQGIASSATDLGELRLSGIISTFLARTSLIVTQPLNSLYWPLQNFLRVKPALELNAVPEFLQLFHSSDVQHLIHRHWILRVIRDGTKTKQDFDVAMRSVIFKMMMDFHSSVLADEESKKLILEVLEATLRIRKACHFLVETYGLIPWLSESANRLENGDSRSLNLVVGIVQRILENYDTRKVLHDNYRIILLRILLSVKIQDLRNPFHVEKYLNVLGKIIEKKIAGDLLDFEAISGILESCKKVFADVQDCEDLLRHGCQFLRENKPEGRVGSLRSLISVWWKNRTS